jgi:hypothetical protein
MAYDSGVDRNNINQMIAYDAQGQIDHNRFDLMSKLQQQCIAIKLAQTTNNTSSLRRDVAMT